MAEQIIFTVSRLNSYVKNTIEEDSLLQYFLLEGEISGFKQVSSGHWYFTLKDELSSVTCVMYRSSAQRTSFAPENGMTVRVSGRASLYDRTGAFQVVCQAMRPAGKGDIYQKLEQLKLKLQDEGLFDESRKRKLPFLPRKIAVVTSPTGAVIHDICQVAKMRNPMVSIVLIPTLVQGDEAAAMISDALKKASTIPDVDVVIVGRGGGSPEDLWCFNEEIVARAIAACPFPVISAVGHESDFTIADMVSDKRASTPSNAAEIAVPTVGELAMQLSSFKKIMDMHMDRIISGKQMSVLHLASVIDKCSPEKRIERLQLQRSNIESRIEGEVNRTISEKSIKIENYSSKLETAMNAVIMTADNSFQKLKIKLAALNPENVMKRGYAIVTTIDGSRVVTNKDCAIDEKKLVVNFSDGSLKVNVEEIN